MSTIKKRVKSYHTNKVCCNRHKSLIEVTMINSVLGKSYTAKCLDCGNLIEGYVNVKNLLITNNPMLTSFLLNKSNQN